MINTIKKRIYFFDLLKILAISFVFLYHILMDMYVIHTMHNLSIINTLLIRPNMHMAMIACATFIFISGATLTLNKRNEEPLEFYKKRLIRILIPFYIAYIINFLIRVINLRSIHVFKKMAKWRVIFTAMGIDEYLNACGIDTYSLGVGEWFLGCILLCYLVYPLLLKLHRRFKYPFFAIMTIYFILINVFYNKLGFVIPSHMNFFCHIYNFYLGIFLIDTSFIVKIKKWMLIVSIPIFLFFYFYNKVLVIPDNFKTTIVLLSLFIIFSFCEKFLENNRVMMPFIDFFNKISFEIFLVHHFVIYQVDYLLNYERIGGLKTLVVIFIDFVLTILFAIAVNILTREVTKFVYKTDKK